MLVKVCTPRAPILIARSASAIENSTSFILTAAANAGNRFGCLATKLGHRIVGHLGQIVGRRAFGDVLDRRIRQRDDLPVVVADLVHILETQIEVEQLAHAAQPLAHVAELGRAALQLLKEPVRENVGVDIDDH